MALNPTPSRWTARVLRAEREAILRAWEEQVQRGVPSLRPLSRPVLINHLPDVLDALATWLDTDADDPIFPELSRAHGVQRLGHGILLRELMREYQILREVVLRRLAPHELDAPDEARGDRNEELVRLHRGLDLGVTIAAEAYADLRQDAMKALQERLHLALHSGGIGTWDYNPHLRLLDGDPRGQELLGNTSPGSITYDGFLARLHPDDRVAVDAQFQRALAEGERGRLQIDYRLGSDPDAPPVWRRSEGRPLVDAQGHVAALIGTVIDITPHRDRLAVEQRAYQQAEASREQAERSAREQLVARQQAEQARARSDFLVRAGERLAQRLHVTEALQQVADLIVPALADLSTVFLLDPQGRPRRLAVAPPGRLTIGTDPALAERMPVFPADHPIHHVIATGEPRPIDVLAWAEREANPAYLAEVRALGVTESILVPILAQGRVLGVFSAAIVDSGRRLDEPQRELLQALGRQAGLIVQNSQLYESADQLRRQAEEASVAKDQFFANVSHELRTPLTSMLGWARLLREEPGVPDKALLDKGLATIERNARSQAQLIEDMLDLSRVVTGKLILHPAVVSLADAVDAALDSARPAAEAKRIQLEARIDPEAGTIVADPDRLQQVIWNLAANAVKFTPPGGTVRIGTRRAGSRCEITVEDSGQGIAPEFLPHIFDRFQQAQPGKAGGLGLGLTIVRHLVELHGGTIAVDSPGRDQGTRFTVTLPIRAASLLSDPPERAS
ncbi:MAG: GAF domain-containing protein, partial [Myxococcales bacterium]